MYICRDGGPRVYDFWFKHSDGSVTQGTTNSQWGSYNCDSHSYWIPATGVLPGRLIGFQFARYFDGHDYIIRNDSISLFLDIDACSLT